MEFSLNTLENLLLKRQIKQMEHDSLVLAKEFTAKDKTRKS